MRFWRRSPVSPGHRAIAWVSLLVVIAGGCSASRSNQEATRTTGKYGSGVDLEFDKNKPVEEQVPEAHGLGGGAAELPVQQRPSSTGGGTRPNIRAKAQDYGETGQNAFFYLNSQVPELVVELDAVQGQAPSQATLSLLHERLESVADKPAGIRLLPIETIPASSKTEWTMTDISVVEEQNRDNFNSREKAVIYILFLNGEPKDGGAIGIAYASSSMVIFTQRIRGAATPLVSAESIEKAAAVHEVGHLLSLVNLGYTSPRDHADPEHPSHSKNPGSVMYWAVDNVGVATLLGGRTEPPNDYDGDDRADLADVKAGKLG